jgi:hypothetical protein
LYAPVNNQLSYFSQATPKHDVSNIDYGFVGLKQWQVISSATEEVFHIKGAEIDIEESEHAFSKRFIYNNSFLLYYLSLLCLFNIFKTSLIPARLSLFIPNRRYILFQVFRL